MNPFKRYQQSILENGFSSDVMQEQAMAQLQKTYDEFIVSTQPGTLRNWLTHKFYPKKVSGVYLWGDVGVGKTWLMDIFYESLPGEKKMRMHFHRFMQFIHQELQVLQGEANPLQKIVTRLVKQARIICLDEFLVNDITDAMLLGNLLETFFAQGLVLVTTANVAPDDLYRNGLQRNRFLPAIELLTKNLRVFHLETTNDYRLRVQKPARVYFYPLDENAAKNMHDAFVYFSQGEAVQSESLQIAGRAIPVIRCGQKVVWFDFHDLCSSPRSQLDYIEISKRFSVVLISNLSQIPAQNRNIASYVIKLIDVFYDARIKLIVSAEVPIADLYVQGDLAKDFKRTLSRLMEMQGEEY